MGLYDSSTVSHLRPWLIKALEPICDADPEVLSDYVLALLKHEAAEAELRTMFVQQLQDFLETEAAPFVDKLFQTLRTRSYIPYDDVQPASGTTGIPIPLDSLVTSPHTPRGTKRISDSDLDRGSRPPPKGPRLSDGGRYSNGRNSGPSNHSRGGARGAHGVNSGRSGPSYPNGRNGSSNAGPSSDRSQYSNVKEPCRDYHNVGFCPRGELCPFSHGEEAITPQIPFPPGNPNLNFNPMQMMGMMPNGFSMPWIMDSNVVAGVYDPNESRMDMSIPGPGISPVPRNRRGSKPYGPTDAVDLTANDRPPQENLSLTSTEPSPSINSALPLPFFPLPNYLPPNPAPFEHSGVDSGPGTSRHPGPFPGQRGSRGRGRGRGGDSGSFPSNDANFRDPNSRQSDNKTIVVEKIPQDQLSLEAVNDWFKRFGTVTNVAIDAPTQKALVSFHNHDEAHRAWKSEEAVFGNRFVKVFWHRPIPGQGEAGNRMLAASAPLCSDLIARSQLLERQIAERKALIGQLSTASPEEKREIMAKLRKLGDDMPTPSTPEATTPIGNAPPRPTVASTSSGPPSSTAALDRESKIRERLDRELELHSVQGALSKQDSPTTDGDAGASERQSELLAQLAELRKQAAEVGVFNNEIAASSIRGSRGGRGFFRGRGRGRGTFAPRGGRGGGVVKSLKLDNRTRKLVVKGINVQDEGAMAAVEEWYRSTSELESFQASGKDEILVQFTSRGAAEQALAKGTSIPNVGTVQVAWHIPPRPSAPITSPVGSTVLVADAPLTSTLPSTNTPSPPSEAPTPNQLGEEMEAPRPKYEEPGRQDDDDGWGASSFDE
ncbi:hypothetical protein BS47DRAFT_1485487 [Hydnum rufescens UP504]|uniref:Uncharacterized protein n=1 Tax=Hydnum rufescens UP504 TaxID=1448309 RepID=A0A9P6DWF5_9AGAM|nr:hypothetical protein BS47DRAFT_1485487 [Hydnum rufescens UP504]